MTFRKGCCRASNSKGVALILVLCFVVLISGLVLALLARSLSSGLIADASANGTRAYIYGRGAVDQIIGDLRQEIVAGSANQGASVNTLSVYTNPEGTVSSIYRPAYTTNAVPYESGPYAPGTANWTNLPNLVKESAHGVPFEPYDSSVPQRAAAASSTTPSRNGRYVSLDTWNEALLLPKASATVKTTTSGTTIKDTGTSVTPNTTAGYFTTPPDWILSAVDGSNPTALDASNNLTTSNTNPRSQKYVVGRYAYTIYNEGGLLDANVAGSPGGYGPTYPPTALGSGPSSTGGPSEQIVWSRKGPESFADLTLIPGIAQAGSPSSVANSLVGWRNTATAETSSSSTSYPSYPLPSSTGIDNYFSYILGLPSRFLSVGANKGVSDQAFTSRQQLISFMNALANGNSSDEAYLQDAMMYLGTFTRTLNQPSYWPATNRPKVVAAAAATASSYTGGNTAFGLDDSYNPPFKQIRVTSTFTRNDGTPAIVGEPLVKKRFPLSRLCWLTYKGPSNDLLSSNPSDPLITSYLASGITKAFLQEGTDAAILSNFGLKWTLGSGSGGIGGYWTYQSNPNPQITLLGSITGREPNFFELLKAAITAGSLGKASGTINQTTNEVKADSSIDINVFQIGANMIDENDPDSFPTQIVTGTLGYNSSVWGKEDLPYLTTLTAIGVVATPANPLPPANGSANADTLINPGKGMLLVVPAVWAPYVSNPPANSSLAPTALRIGVSSLEPATGARSSSTFNVNAVTPAQGTTAATNVAGGTSAVAAWSTIGTFNSATGTIMLPAESSPNDSLLFTNNSSSLNTLYRDPTPLWQPSVPAGSGLTIDGENLLEIAGYNNGVPENGTSPNYIGFCALNGGYAIRYTNPNPAAATAGQQTVTVTSMSETSSSALTTSLEYQSGSAWISYYQDCSEPSFIYTNMSPSYAVNSSGTASGDMPALKAFTSNHTENPSYDPRSSRIGRPPDIGQTGWQDAAQTMLLSSRPIPSTGFISSHTANPGGTAALFYSNVASSSGSGVTAFGQTAQNVYATSGNYFYYADADGVVRRGMAGAVSAFTPGSPVALPTMSVGSSTVSSNNAGNLLNRPILLNRPFRSVAELGCVFRDEPWRNLDFSQPESGDSALLDVFCINEDYRPDALMAGQVDLNGKQAPVFQSIVEGAYRDEILSGANGYNQVAGGPSNQTALAKQESILVAQALVQRTSVLPPTGNPAHLTTPQPLSNIADLVGRLSPALTSAPTVGSTGINGAAVYDGLTADLNAFDGNTIYLDPGSEPSGFAGESYEIQRFREAAIRALSDSGQAGTWNLLIDLVAQSGRYPANAASLNDFLVDGERHYWVHVAIDRSTGQVIDENIENISQ